MSTENLYKVSNRDGSRGDVLASKYQNIGVTFMKSPSLSERVCHPCARKIRNLHKLFVEIKNAASQDEAELGDHSNATRSKRQLPTSVSTPDRSPSNRKVSRTSRGEVPSSRKSLFSEVQNQHEQNEPSNSSENQSRNEVLLLEHSKNDDLLGNKEAMVKAIIVHPNGNVVVRTPVDKQSKNLVKNISLKNWKAVANDVIGHDALREELTTVLQRAILSEFKEYSRSDSVLKGTEPDQLAGSSAKLLLEEIRILCPL